ncbi:choice-of-anchor D domain-containing protein [Archangium primigenium]|uniref:choice-of-anchor D domain-containing protein n=1 Tax=[Archangium] primigenium TaxID=2792470 RepID=UPI00195C484A|nr:choice-of-anchor D domain-containing protein [Archangium primigenium]MBM7113483.1 choice-of-anchor D domain-containing protein [Archangium primigenium]
MALRNVLVLVGLALLAACGPGALPAASENAPPAGEAPALRFAFAGPEDTLDLGTSTPVLDFGPVRVGTQSARVLELRNLGSTPVKLESLALSAGQAFTLRSLPALPYTLEPQAVLKLEVGFAPLVEGALAQTLKLTSNDPATPLLTVDLRGLGVAPRLVVTPSSVLEFGAVRVGHAKTLEVQVQNRGTGSVTIPAVNVQGASAFVLDGAPIFPLTLAPDGIFTLRVRFTPMGEGAFAAQLSLKNDDPSAEPLGVAMRGQGAMPRLETPYATLDFGTVALGTSSVQRVFLRNTGSGDTFLHAADIAGAPAFSLHGATFPLVLPAGAMTTFEVKYHPTQAGASLGKLTFVTDEGLSPLSITLQGQGGGGTGTDPDLVWAPSAIDFGAQRKGTTATRLLTVTNEGTAPRIITAVALDAHAYPVFTATTLPLLPFFLAPGSSVQFQVTFNPVGTGAFASALTLTTSDPLSPSTSVPLTGTGTGTAFGAD